MNAEIAFEDMVFYGSEFLKACSEFLTTPPVFWFVVFGILFFIGVVVKRMVS